MLIIPALRRYGSLWEGDDCLLSEDFAIRTLDLEPTVSSVNGDGDWDIFRIKIQSECYDRYASHVQHQYNNGTDYTSACHSVLYIENRLSMKFVDKHFMVVRKLKASVDEIRR